MKHAAAMAMRVLDCLLLLLALKVVHAAAPVQRSIVPDLTPVLIKQLQQANISKYCQHNAMSTVGVSLHAFDQFGNHPNRPCCESKGTTSISQFQHA